MFICFGPPLKEKQQPGDITNNVAIVFSEYLVDAHADPVSDERKLRS